MAKMRIAPSDRPKVKAECLRLLATLQLDPARTRLLSGFVDTYLRLNQQEEDVFQAEVGRLEESERESVMQIVTSWMEQGLEQGRREAQTAIAQQMLVEKLPVETIARITGLSLAQLQQLQATQQQE